MGRERLDKSERSAFVEGLVARFGHEQQYIRAKMRDCNDVPRFLANLENAHKQTSKSKLNFGPGASRSEK